MNVREDVWFQAWLTIAKTDSSKKCELDVPTIWADKCLEDFDKRFPAKQGSAGFSGGGVLGFGN